jgi:decaprenylphospho-beta-D-erythro-pentofuranosid-2-ulose 2-reductase
MLDALGRPQTLLLLGATSDIAQAVARRYLAGGPLRILLAARPSEQRRSAAAALAAEGADVEELDFEARDVGSHRALVDAAWSRGDVDVTVVAFGLLGDAEQAWQDHGTAVELAQVNYVGAVSVGVLVAERLRVQGHGALVALSSVAGERVRRSNFVYGSTKAGMDGFYLGLGEALAEHGARVLVVRPGFVRTKMTAGLDVAPLSVTADEVAAAVLDGLAKQRELVWVPGAMRVVMSGLRHVPRPLFRRLPV